MPESTRRRPLKRLVKRIQTGRVKMIDRRIERLGKRKSRIQKRSEG